jgi:hypothetical protein
MQAHLKKSLAAKILQCAFRNVDHVVRFPRSGAGSMPLRFNTSIQSHVRPYG